MPKRKQKPMTRDNNAVAVAQIVRAIKAVPTDWGLERERVVLAALLIAKLDSQELIKTAAKIAFPAKDC